MKLAILIDGGYLRAQWQVAHGRSRLPAASDVHSIIAKIHDCVCARHSDSTVRLLRTYYYDTEPFNQSIVDPDGRSVDFLANPQH